LLSGNPTVWTVTAQKWQKEMIPNCLDTKEESLIVAGKIVTESGLANKIGMNHNMSDAVLISVWASRNYKSL
jgi:hypothetical protein